MPNILSKSDLILRAGSPSTPNAWYNCSSAGLYRVTNVLSPGSITKLSEPSPWLLPQLSAIPNKSLSSIIPSPLASAYVAAEFDTHRKSKGDGNQP